MKEKAKKYIVQYWFKIENVYNTKKEAEKHFNYEKQRNDIKELRLIELHELGNNPPTNKVKDI